MNHATSNDQSSGLNLFFYLVLSSITIFFLMPGNAQANKMRTHYKHASQWCQSYTQRTGHVCRVGPLHGSCPAGYSRARSFGRLRINRYSACIRGNVANKHTPDYVLQCRGGGNMFARVPVKGNIEIRGMKKARSAASARKPGAGECAFLDRPLSSREPSQLRYKTGNASFTHIDISSKAIAPGWTREPIVNVLKAIRGGQLFYVHVRNDRGWLDIRRVGP